MKKVLFLFLISFKTFAEPCNVELFSKVYKLEANQALSSNELIKNSSCDVNINSNILNIVSKKQGEVYLSEIENEIGNQNLHITPRKIFIGNLQKLFRDQLTENTNLYFFDVKTVGSLKTIQLSEEDTIKSYCDSCNTYGEKNVKIEITNILNNTSKALWYSSKIFAKIKVIKAKNSLNFQQKSLSKDDFYTDETYTMMPENILGTLENIQFYKPNKTIMAGSIITNMDIMPINLVSNGVPVKAMLKNQNLNLIKMAIPSRSAQFGENVELKVGNNKTITGKVVDFNQVVIEL